MYNPSRVSMESMYTRKYDMYFAKQQLGEIITKLDTVLQKLDEITPKKKKQTFWQKIFQCIWGTT